jgi:hypothetical protein
MRVVNYMYVHIHVLQFLNLQWLKIIYLFTRNLEFRGWLYYAICILLYIYLFIYSIFHFHGNWPYTTYDILYVLLLKVCIDRMRSESQWKCIFFSHGHDMIIS